MFRKMPVVLGVMIIFLASVYSWIPLLLQSTLYGVSLSIKSLIVFLLPFIVFGLLFKAASLLAKSSSKWIFGILIAVCLSNFFSTMLSYTIALFAYSLDLSIAFPEETDSLLPLLSFSFPKLLDNSYAMFFGVLFGGILGWWKSSVAERISAFLEKGIFFCLKSFLYLIPVFVAGFIVKMIHDGSIGLILQNYLFVFAIVAVAVFSYILFLYALANGFQRKQFIVCLKNMLPAAITGFGSMSSAAAMPLTLIGTEKNAKNPVLAKSVIPATVNIHLIGDCFAIPIFAFAILKSFGVAEPSITSYLIFSLYFILAKFSVAAVPGGGILVMIPVLEKHLGLQGEMLSLITALYILFDPLITAANVLGNGAFALGIGHLFKDKSSVLYEESNS